MLAYKFLTPGAVGLFSGFAWPAPEGGAPGRWVEVEGPLQPCGNGIHACRLRDLPFWIADELWRIELAGETVAVDRGLLGRRGRLVSCVDSWATESVVELARACSLRVRAVAATSLRAEGFEAQADVLAGCTDLEAFATAVPPVAGMVGGDTGVLLGYAANTVDYALEASSGDAAWASCAAYCSAFAAGFAASGTAAGARGSAAYLEERAWQAKWLARRLELEPGSL